MMITAESEMPMPTLAERGAALKRWCEEHAANADDPALAEAARIARVFIGRDGPEFDPASFAELVEFIEELPF
ncbi:hypothetical protein DMC47_32130 [Nostoc sp. 3335mG]|nr:hypothetical protein DMC47_32130 [Nostoc sp. 3335mG]